MLGESRTAHPSPEIAKPFAEAEPTSVNRQDLLVANLESLAAPTWEQGAKPIQSGFSLDIYSSSFLLPIADYANKIMQNYFPGERLIAADIGGSPGIAARDFEQRGAHRCFVIDPSKDPVVLPPQFPANRFIQRSVEDMSNIPDNSFHFAMSYGALPREVDISKSLSETARVLRPKGKAIIDFEWWSERNHCAALESLNLVDASLYLIVPSGTGNISTFRIKDAVTEENRSVLRNHNAYLYLSKQAV